MPDEKTFPTTPDQFAIFQEEAALWLDRFGLKEWQVFILHENLEDVGILAQCHWKTPSRQAKLILNTKVDVAPSDNKVRVAAFHEVCELLLSQTTEVLEEIRPWTWYNAEIHRIIRTLENAVWWPDWKARGGK